MPHFDPPDSRDDFPASPDDPGDYPANEPTRYGGYAEAGGVAYSEYGPPTGYGQYNAPNSTLPLAPLPPPWHQRPAVLVGFGVLTAVVLALLVYAVVKFTNAGSSTRPPIPSGSITPTAGPTPARSGEEPGPTGGTAEQSVPSSEPPSPAPTEVTTSAAPSTTEAPASSATVSPSVTTVTETTTKPLFPTLPRPRRPIEEVPGGG